jgi:cytochrome c-type biogenesis protein
MVINPITFGMAFLAGMAAFLSPCVLPLIPIYLLFITGASAKEAVAETKPKTLLLSLGFVLGVAAVFSVLGASASAIGIFLNSYHLIVEKVAGAIVIFLGLNITGLISWGPLARHHHHISGEVLKKFAGSFLGAFLVGAAFGLNWTPCVGLELGAFYFLASCEATVWQGASLLFSFAMGLGMPFIAAGLMLKKFDTFSRKINRHLPKIQRASGVMICLLGLLMFTGQMHTLHHWLAQTL